MQPRILYSARPSFRIEGEIKSFPEKQKLKEFMPTKPGNFKEDFLTGEKTKKKKKKKRPKAIRARKFQRTSKTPTLQATYWQ